MLTNWFSKEKSQLIGRWMNGNFLFAMFQPKIKLHRLSTQIHRNCVRQKFYTYSCFQTSLQRDCIIAVSRLASQRKKKKKPKDYLYQFTYFLSWHRTLSQTILNNLQSNICCTENRSTMNRTGFTKQIYWYLRQCTGTDHIIENLWRFLEKEGF